MTLAVGFLSSTLTRRFALFENYETKISTFLVYSLFYFTCSRIAERFSTIHIRIFRAINVPLTDSKIFKIWRSACVSQRKLFLSLMMQKGRDLKSLEQVFWLLLK